MLTHFLDLLAAVISVTSLLIVTYGALIGIISFLKNEIRRFTGGYSITNIRKLRATFGTYLLLGLEFLIASDILKTVLEPTLNELALLGGIVVLRTILSVFLNKDKKKLVNRLSRIEGQIRGIKKMIENDAYCNDVLIQSAAVGAAINAFNRELLSNHIHSCVVRDIREGKDEVVDELMVTLQKLIK